MYFTDLPRDSRFAVLASNANCSSVEKIGESIIVVILGSMPFCVELDNLKDTDAPIHQPAAMLVAAD